MDTPDFMPPDLNIPGIDRPIPHTVLADEAFPLRRNLLRPFSAAAIRKGNPEQKYAMRCFNYRLSR